jgi:uncharacterized phage protein (TIGR01671 family)
MAREIKFRIWNAGGNNMLCDVENVYECLMQQIRFDGSQPSRMNKVKYDHRSEGMVWMQYTGLKDKNGKEIYEGDVIIFKVDFPDQDFDNGVVRWSDRGYWTAQKETDLEQLLYDELTELQGEVIGNIYENPELIK